MRPRLKRGLFLGVATACLVLGGLCFCRRGSNGPARQATQPATARVAVDRDPDRPHLALQTGLQNPEEVIGWSKSRHLAVVSDLMGTVAMVKPDTAEIEADLATGSDPVRIAVFSTNEELLATGGGTEPSCLSRDPNHGEAQIWNCETGQIVAQLPDFPGPIRAMAFAPDGRTLATMYLVVQRLPPTVRCVVQIWDTASGRLVTTIPDLGEVGGDLAFSPDGRTLAVSSFPLPANPLDNTWNTRIRFYDANRFEPGKFWIIRDKEGAEFRWLADSSGLEIWNSGKIKTRDLRSGRVTDSRPVAAMPNGPDWVDSVEGGKFGDSLLRRLKVPASGQVPLAMAPDGALALDCEGGTISLIPGSGQVGRSLRIPGTTIEDLAFSPDNKYLLGEGSQVIGRHRHERDELMLWKRPDYAHPRVVPVSGKVNDLDFSPDSKSFVTSGSAGHIWSTLSLNPTRTLTQGQFTQRDQLISPGEPIRYPGGTYSGPIPLPKWRENDYLGIPMSVELRPRSASAPSAGKYSETEAAVTSWESDVIVMKVPSGRLVADLSLPREAINAIYSADGSKLAVYCGNGRIRIYGTKDYRLLATTQVLHLAKGKNGDLTADWITSLPSGYYSATSGADNYIRWLFHGRLLPASAFASSYCRPDLVAAALQR